MIGNIVLITIAIYGLVFAVKNFVFIKEIVEAEPIDMEVNAAVIQLPNSDNPLKLMNQKTAGKLNLLTLNKLYENVFEAQIFIAQPWDETFSENGSLSNFSIALAAAFTDLYDTHFEEDNKKAVFIVTCSESSNAGNGIMVKASISEILGNLNTEELQEFFDVYEEEIFKKFKKNLSDSIIDSDWLRENGKVALFGFASVK